MYFCLTQKEVTEREGATDNEGRTEKEKWRKVLTRQSGYKIAGSGFEKRNRRKEKGRRNKQTEKHKDTQQSQRHFNATAVSTTKSKAAHRVRVKVTGGNMHST